jgi:hypothetical protein
VQAGCGILDAGDPAPAHEVRSGSRLQALLDEHLAPDELERLLSEGAKMSEEEACRRALAD